jgi:diketogulonate reductase-like aldo/keto reductase
MTQKYIELNSGHTILTIGLGVYKTPQNVAKDIVVKALEVGYRHVDSAQAYQNEHEVCEGIAEWIKQDPAKNKREDVFYTTKIREANHGYELTKKSIEQSLKLAKNIGYIDLFLVHSPQSNYEKRHGTWMALQEAVESGLVKSIGVSNYGIKHLEELLAYSDLKIVPALNQVELHPWLTRTDLVDFCRSKGIVVEAYSPLTRGQKVDDAGLKKIAAKYGKTTAQILLNWSLSKGFVTLPKTITPERLLPNLQSADFELSVDDVKMLDSWDEYLVTVPEWDPTVYPLDNEK